VLQVTSKRVTLSGPLSVVGKALVVSAKADDEGAGANEESSRTGTWWHARKHVQIIRCVCSCGVCSLGTFLVVHR